MATVARIVFANARINEALQERDVTNAAKWMLRLHKIEIKDKVPIGSYRFR